MIFNLVLNQPASAVETISMSGQTFQIGQVYDAFYTSYYPEDSALQGGFNDKIGYPLDPSLPTCASPTKFPYGTVFRIIGTGTFRDGSFCISNDTGGSILVGEISASSIDIDLLSPDHDTAYGWGEVRGQIVILKLGDGSGPLTEADFVEAAQLNGTTFTGAVGGGVMSGTGAAAGIGANGANQSSVYQTQQLSKEEEKFNTTNKINFYNKYTAVRDVCSTSSLASGLAVGTELDADEKKRADVLLRYFTAKGFTLAQAAGIVGNLYQESHLNPATIQDIAQGYASILDNPYDPVTKKYQYDMEAVNLNDGDQGIGLAQWSYPERKKALVDFATSQSKHPFDLDVQLTYLWNELTTSQKSCFNDNQTPMANSQNALDGKTNVALNKATNPIDAAITFHDCYEQSGDYDNGPQAVINNRGAYAEKYYTNFKGIISDGTGVSINQDSVTLTSTTASDAKLNLCAPGLANLSGAGGLQGMISEVAWPLFCGGSSSAPDRTLGLLECHALSPKPGYAVLIAQNSEKGIYHGGYGGQDCGGFVSNVLISSGFDRNYNKLSGGTDAQEQWLRNPASGWGLQFPMGAVDTAKLLPGDVAFTDGHTFMYVGDVPGFEYKAASASYNGTNQNSDQVRGGRYPMAAAEMNSANEYRWWRKTR